MLVASSPVSCGNCTTEVYQVIGHPVVLTLAQQRCKDGLKSRSIGMAPTAFRPVMGFPSLGLQQKEFIGPQNEAI
ncbi:unnamed protein product [Protopolystoma xenopodis]|uniref:Uncharacterized protein n=1 Tax=Protopolystoma xenopodis TaxID=117903 RepID=A0A3S5CQ67_9PLAT|nr:unnamed protein product [Protopolystoma xenopodis]